MSSRREFVELAKVEGANVSELCRRFGISRKTGHKWIGRERGGEEGWEADRSRRPLHSPGKVAAAVEERVLAERAEHAAWGGRKIRRRLQDKGQSPPAASTVTAILRRNGKIEPLASLQKGPMTRFERAEPNELWQMDFKGAVPMASGGKCHPLTIVDDHSRYAVCVQACADEQAATTREAMTVAFRRYGLPVRMLMDNGACWGRVEARYTLLNAWMLRLGIRISHGRPRHPQTQGKDERFNRTLKDEALRGTLHTDLKDFQKTFDAFRAMYNHERPHEALGLATPATRYRVSAFEFPETLPPIEYLDGDIVRRVGAAGYVSYKKHRFQVGRAFTGEPVGLRPTERDGVYAVYFCHQRIARIDLKGGLCEQV